MDLISKKILTIIYFVSILILKLSAQTINCTYIPSNLNLTNLYDKINFNSDNTENYDAINLINRMLEPTGLKSNFIPVKFDGLDNCAAINLDGLRFIAYDEKFLQALNKFGKTDWIKVSVFAHEIGHHLNGHTLIASASIQENILKELEADEFSGFLLQKLGATLEESITGISLLASINDSETHPSKEKRLIAIEKGFNKALNQDYKLLKTNTESSLDYYLVKANEDINLFLKSFGSKERSKRDRNLTQIETNYLNNVISKTTAAIEINKNTALSYFYRATANFYLNKINEAFKDLVVAEELGYNSFKFYNLYSETFNRQVAFDKALEAVNKSIEKDKKNEILHDNLSLRSKINWKLGLHKESIKDLSDLITLYLSKEENKQAGTIYYNRGNKYEELEQYNAAISDYEKAIELNPSSPSAYANKASTLSMIKKYDSALLDINIAIKLKPTWNYYMIRGFHIYVSLGEYEKAESDIDKAIELNPNCFECYYRRGALNMKKKLYKEALYDYEEAEKNCEYKNIIFNIDYLYLLYAKVEAHLYLQEYETALRKVTEITELFDARIKPKNYESPNEIFAKAYTLKAHALYYLNNPECCKYYQIACKLSDESSCKHYQNLCK